MLQKGRASCWDKGDQRVRAGPSWPPAVTTHPAQAHAAAALLQVQGLQKLLHRLQREVSVREAKGLPHLRVGLPWPRHESFPGFC